MPYCWSVGVRLGGAGGMWLEAVCFLSKNQLSTEITLTIISPELCIKLHHCGYFHLVTMGASGIACMYATSQAKYNMRRE